MNATDASYFAVPLGREAHAIAQQQAIKTSLPKRKRIYLNMLAVITLHHYLKWLQIETEFSERPEALLFDRATLIIPNVGQIECRPVLPGETTVSVPPEATQNRIGYVAVQLNEDLNEGQILGFLDAVAYPDGVEEIAIAELAPIEELLEKFSVRPEHKSMIALSQWLDQQFEPGWQTLEALLNSFAQPALNFRHPAQSDSVSGGRFIDLGLQLKDSALALVITLSPEVQGVMNICVQVCSVGNAYLPSNLKLTVMDDRNQITREVSTRAMDDLIQLSFDGEVGEAFRVKIVLGEMNLIEEFTI
jgi:hypothetical protein